MRELVLDWPVSLYTDLVTYLIKFGIPAGVAQWIATYIRENGLLFEHGLDEKSLR